MFLGHLVECTWDHYLQNHSVNWCLGAVSSVSIGDCVNRCCKRYIFLALSGLGTVSAGVVNDIYFWLCQQVL